MYFKNKTTSIKKWVLLIFINSIFFVFLYVHTGNINNIPVEITSYGYKNQSAISSEVWLTSINADGNELDLSKCALENGFTYNSDYDDIVFPGIESGKKYTQRLLLKPYMKTIISFATGPYCGIIGITDGENYTEFDLYSINSDVFQYEVQANKIDNIVISKITIPYIIKSLTILIILSIIILRLKQKQLEKIKFKSILLFVLSQFAQTYFWILYSYYYRDLNFLTVFVLSSIFFVFSYGLGANKIIFMNKKFLKTFLFFAVSIYISFSLWGNSIFLNIEKTRISYLDLFIFCGLTNWVCVAELFIIKYLNKFIFILQKFIIKLKFFTNLILICVVATSNIILPLTLYKILYTSYNWKNAIPIILGFSLMFLAMSLYTLYKSSYKSLKEKNCFFIFFNFSLIVFIPILLICNPGCLTIDTFDQFNQLLTGVYSDHHPIMHTFFEGGILLLFRNVMAITIFQVIFFSFVNARCASFLFKKGISNTAIWIYLYISTFLPATLINIVTLWKDIPFSISILWITILLAEILDDIPAFFRNWNKLSQFFIALFIIGTFRHNGIVTILGLVIVFCFISIYIHKCRSAIILLLSCTVIMISKFLVFQLVDITPNGSIASVVLYHGMAYVDYLNQELPDDIEKYLTNILPDEKIKELYSISSASPFMYTAEADQYDTMNKFRNADLKETLFLYLKTFTKYPYLIIKDRLFGTDLLWDVTQGQYSYNYMYTMEIENNPFNITRIETPFIPFFSKYLQLSQKWQMVFWRSGIYIDILLLSIFISFNRKKYRIFIISLPCILNTISLFLSMAWQDFRYVWFILLSTPFILFYGYTEIRERKVKEHGV